MPPVIHVASTLEPDTEATAELPVLDVAAYEAAREDALAHTDKLVKPASSSTFAAADVTAKMPAIKSDSIPTLHPADFEAASSLDLSGTHEMPAMLRTKL